MLPSFLKLNGVLMPVSSEPLSSSVFRCESFDLMELKLRAGGGSFLSKPNVTIVSLRPWLPKAVVVVVGLIPAASFLAMCCSNHALMPTNAVALICTINTKLTRPATLVEVRTASTTQSDMARSVEKPCKKVSWPRPNRS
jgi:hypothetical protein